MTDPRIARELAAIEAFEQGPESQDPAYLAAQWRVDWMMEQHLMEAENGR